MCVKYWRRSPGKSRALGKNTTTAGIKTVSPACQQVADVLAAAAAVWHSVSKYLHGFKKCTTTTATITAITATLCS